MRKMLVPALALCLLAPAVHAQEATPEAGAAAASASDQVVLNGMVVLDTVTMPVNGWVVIHSDIDGQLGHHVGIQQVVAGESTGVVVMIDGAMSTPTLHIALHEDTGEIGVYEHADDPALDPAIAAPDGAPAFGSFNIAAVFAFDQQPIGDSFVVASTILAEGGWVVIHADENGAPGPVLGQAPIMAGTTAPVIVPLLTEGRTSVVYPMLHFDTGAVGTYEFGAVEGADLPVVISDVVAFKAVNLTDAPTVLLTDGRALDNTQLPAINVTARTDADLSAAQYDLTIDQVITPVNGFVDVHNDSLGHLHPGGSLGHAFVAAGDNAGVVVALIPKPLVPLTATVFPMLHADTDNDGVYQYNKVVGEDLPVVLNGMVLTIPVTIAEAMMDHTDMPMGEATAEATVQMIPEMTAEATMEMTPEATPDN